MAGTQGIASSFFSQVATQNFSTQTGLDESQLGYATQGGFLQYSEVGFTQDAWTDQEVQVGFASQPASQLESMVVLHGVRAALPCMRSQQHAEGLCYVLCMQRVAAAANDVSAAAQGINQVCVRVCAYVCVCLFVSCW